MTEPETELEFSDFIRLVLNALEAAHLTYLIGGAVAVWAWGDVRTTRDLDVVIELPIEQIASLSQELKKRDMLVPIDIIIDLLLEDRGDLPINAIHLHTGYKAELFLLRADDKHRALSLTRRRLVDLGPPLGQVYVHSPEDLILNKLCYFSLSRQPKHVRDIRSMILTVGDELDLAYIEAWAEQLDVTEVWQEIFQTAPGSLQG